MRFPQIMKLLIAGLMVCHHCPAYAWGMTGHRIVGGLAERHLSDEALKAVRRVLDGYKLQDISNWADEIKSDRSALSQSLSKWHYIEAEEMADLDVLSDGDWPQDIHDALRLITTRLQKKQFDAPLTEPVLLRLLVHLVADAHQPLHVGNGKDQGANACYVRWFGSKWTMRLHAVWDSKLINAFLLSYSEYVDYIDHIDQETIARWQSEPISQWLKESRALHKAIYPQDKRSKISDYCVAKKSQLKIDKVPKIGYEYQSRVRPILNKRLAQAGIRLAGVLNAVYNSPAVVGTDE